MILEYHRPTTMGQAKFLLTRPEPKTVPVALGSFLYPPSTSDFAVVDVQDLGLEEIKIHDGQILIGAAATLGSIVDSDLLPDYLILGAKRDANTNIRNSMTLGGELVRGMGHSLLCSNLLAANAGLIWESEAKVMLYEEWIAKKQVPGDGCPLLVEVNIDQENRVRYETIERTPVDIPSILFSIGFLSTGEIRVILGGAVATPIVIYSGAQDFNLAVLSTKNAYRHFINPQFDDEYFQEISRVLLGRLFGEQTRSI